MEPKMLVTEAAEAVGLTVQALHNQIKRKNLPHQKSKNRVYFSHQTAKQLFEFKFQPEIICFQIIKGGVGKTTLCLASAIRASLYGAKVLLIDLDQQGNLTSACQISAYDKPVMIDLIEKDMPLKEGIVPVCEGIDILHSRIENALLDTHLMIKRLPLDPVYRDVITPFKNHYDLILIDCPPALGSSVTAAALASDRVISPVTPSPFSIEGLEITSRELLNIEKNFKISIPLYPVLNEFDARTSLSTDTLRFLVAQEKYKSTLFRTVIRKSQEFDNVIKKGISIFDSLAYSTAKEDIDLFTRELLKIGHFSARESNYHINSVSANTTSNIADTVNA